MALENFPTDGRLSNAEDDGNFFLVSGLNDHLKEHACNLVTHVLQKCRNKGRGSSLGGMVDEYIAQDCIHIRCEE